MIYTFAVAAVCQSNDCKIAARQKLKLQQNGETKAQSRTERIYVLLLAEAIHLFNVSCILLSSETEQNLRQWQQQRQRRARAGKKHAKCLEGNKKQPSLRVQQAATHA